MTSFLVQYNRVEMMLNDPQKKEIEMQRLQDLMREKLLQRSFISKDHQNIWLHFTVDDRSTLEDILKTLPSCSQMSPEVYLLDE